MPSRFQLALAAHVVSNGGIVTYPTEAVFGLGCAPHNAEAVANILALKGRAVTKGLILLAADISQLWPFIAELPKMRARQILASWPGPTTWIVPARLDTPPWLTGGRVTLAVRVTAHPGAAALCKACNTALVSTSANYAGCLPTRSPLQVRRQFGKAIDYLCPGSCGAELRPSCIIDADSGMVLRA